MLNNIIAHTIAQNTTNQIMRNRRRRFPWIGRSTPTEIKPVDDSKFFLWFCVCGIGFVALFFALLYIGLKYWE